MGKGTAYALVGFLLVSGAPAVAESPVQAAAAVAPGELDSGQPRYFALQVRPRLDMPLGSESSDNYKMGGSLALSAEAAFSDNPALYATGSLCYDLKPIEADNSLSVAAAGVGGGIGLSFTPRISLRAELSGGYYYALFNSISGLPPGSTAGAGNPFVAGGMEVSYLLMPVLNMSAGIFYKNYLGLYQGLDFGLGVSFYLRGRKKRQRTLAAATLRPDLLEAKTPDPGQGVELESVSFEPIYPVFFKLYDDNPVGTAVIANREDTPIRDVAVSLLVKQYMDTPKQCLALPEMEGGGAVELDLMALFTEKVLDITENTKAAAELVLEFTMDEQRYQLTRAETLRFLDRNAVTWTDDRRAAAFVTAKDPAVMGFAKNVVSATGGLASSQLNEHLLKAMALHEALDLYGVSYIIDPNTPYEDYSQNAERVDYLQFPRQTMEYRGGDCDDLAILFCALLESVGTRTAFVTVPGHIFMAVATGLDADKAQRGYLRPEDFAIVDGEAWIPVEITEREAGFLKAWQQGAKQWREHSAAGQAGFYPMESSWSVYEPVQLPGAAATIDLPSEERIIAAYLQEVMDFVEREIFPQVEALTAQIERSGGSIRLRNKLGVLYASYGVYEKAAAEFEAILEAEEYLPALLNLGNILFLNEEWESALDVFDRAERRAADNPKVILSLARVHHELENYGMVRRYYEKLQAAEGELAEKYAYLNLQGEEGTRAADARRLKGVVEWIEE